jgi:hypothetical protein
VSHALQLGVYCDLPTQGETVTYGDIFIDCDDEPAMFGYMDSNGDTEGTTGLRYTCSRSVTFPAGSTSSQTQIIPYVGIMTDLYWSLGEETTCFQTRSTETMPSAPATALPTGSTPSTVPAPTLSSTTTVSMLDTPRPSAVVLVTPRPSANVAVTPAPMEILPSSPILAPLALGPAPITIVALSPAIVPTEAGPAPFTLPTVREIAPTSDSGFVGGAVGATAGVLVVAGVAIFLFLRRKSEGSSTDTNAGIKPPISVNATPPTQGGASGQEYSETEVDVEFHSGASGPQYYSSSATYTSGQQEAEIDLGHPQHRPMPAQTYHQPPLMQKEHTQTHPYMQPQHTYVPQHVPPPHPYAAPPQSMVQQQYQSADLGGGTASFEYDHMAAHPSTTSDHTTPSHPSTTNQHPGHAVQSNTRPVEFKDQARSVMYKVPMTDVQPIIAEAVATPYHPPPPHQPHVMDSSLMSSGTAGTGGSNRSDPDGRRSVDP